MNVQQQKDELLRVRSFLKMDRAFFLMMLNCCNFLGIIFLSLAFNQLTKPNGSMGLVTFFMCSMPGCVWATYTIRRALKMNRAQFNVNNELLKELNEKIERLKNES